MGPMTNDASMNPDTWVTEHGDYLFKYAYLRLGDHASAEDAVQETFLAAMQAADRFDGRVPVKYWLRGILRHKVVDHIRKHARETKVEDFEQDEILGKFIFKAFGIPERSPDSWKFNPRKAYEQKEFWDVFYHCLDGLKGTMRQAFALRELEGQSTEEICKELGVAPNNLWVILHRARSNLKTCLEKNWLQKNTVES